MLKNDREETRAITVSMGPEFLKILPVCILPEQTESHQKHMENMDHRGTKKEKVLEIH